MFNDHVNSSYYEDNYMVNKRRHYGQKSSYEQYKQLRHNGKINKNVSSNLCQKMGEEEHIQKHKIKQQTNKYPNDQCHQNFQQPAESYRYGNLQKYENRVNYQRKEQMTSSTRRPLGTIQNFREQQSQSNNHHYQFRHDITAQYNNNNYQNSKQMLRGRVQHQNMRENKNIQTTQTQNIYKIDQENCLQMNQNRIYAAKKNQREDRRGSYNYLMNKSNNQQKKQLQQQQSKYSYISRDKSPIRIPINQGQLIVEKTQNKYDKSPLRQKTPIRQKTQQYLSENYTPPSTNKNINRREQLINRSKQLKKMVNDLSTSSNKYDVHEKYDRRQDISPSSIVTKTNPNYNRSSKPQSKEICNNQGNKVVNGLRNNENEYQRLGRLKNKPEQRLYDSPYKQQINTRGHSRKYQKYQRSARNQQLQQQQKQQKSSRISQNQEITQLRQLKKTNYPRNQINQQVGRISFFNKQEQQHKPKNTINKKKQLENTIQDQGIVKNHIRNANYHCIVNGRKKLQKEGDCMNRITELNNKINQRISSIINSYDRSK